MLWGGAKINKYQASQVPMHDNIISCTMHAMTTTFNLHSVNPELGVTATIIKLLTLNSSFQYVKF